MARDPARGVSVTSTVVGYDRPRITVAGELDLFTSPQLVDAVTAALKAIPARDVVVDLSGVTFIDASAVGALVHARQECRRVGGRLTVFGARGMVAEVLHLTGVAESLGIRMRAPATGAMADPPPARATDGRADH
jgi:anti-anti-sigma factor